MREIIEKNKGIFFATGIFLLYLIPTMEKLSVILPVIASMIWFYTYLSSDNENRVMKIFNLMVYSLPVSFVSIFGQQSKLSYINWFTVFLIILIIFILIGTKDNIKKIKFDLIVKTLIVTMVGLIISYVLNLVFKNTKNSSQFIMIMLFLLTILLSYTYFKDMKVGKKELDKILTSYSKIIVLLSVGIVVQWVLYLNNIKVGRLIHFSNGRLALGLINFDFSFLSLLLVNNIFYIFYAVSKKKLKISYALPILGLHLFASYLTSARTGLVAFVIVLFLSAFVYVILLNVFKISLRKRVMLFSGAVIVSLVILYIIASGRGFKGSGRNRINVEAVADFMESPIIGKGLGWMGYGFIVPHNFFIQFMVQAGLIFLVPLTMTLTLLLNEIRKKDTFLFLGICVSFVGAMFIPDILNSRFFLVQYMLGIISVNSNKGVENEKYSSLIE